MANPFRCSYNNVHVATGTQIVNTFHVVPTRDFASLGDSTAAAIRDALHAALTTKYRGCMPNTFRCDSLVVREELAPGDLSVPDEASQSIALLGTMSTTGDQFPIPLAALVTFYSDAAIRSGHGRMFCVNPGNANQLGADGNYDTSVTWWTTLWKAFLDELISTHSADDGHSGTNTLHPIVYSRTKRAAGAPNWYFTIVSYTRRSQPHWLRSRATSP